MTELQKQAIAESIACKISICKMENFNYENMRMLLINSEWKGMEQMMKLMRIDFEYEIDEESLDIIAVTVEGVTVKVL